MQIIYCNELARSSPSDLKKGIKQQIYTHSSFLPDVMRDENENKDNEFTEGIVKTVRVFMFLRGCSG